VRIKDFGHAIELNFGPEYFSLGSKFYPKSIRYSERDRIVLEVAVVSLEATTRTSEDQPFSSAGAVYLPWCANEKAPVPIQFSNSRDVKIDLPGLSSIYSFTFPVHDFSLIVFGVRTDGRTEDVKVYGRDGSLETPGDDNVKLLGSTFRPARCGEKPVQGEFIIWPSGPVHTSLK
jgi:hypothetical protein